MVREDIFEGLKIAVSRGDSLQQAMQSFYNSGYKKEEIEEAARALQMFQAGQPIPQTPQPQQTQKIETPQTLSQPIKKQGFFQNLNQQITQIISGNKQNQETSQLKPPEKDKPQKLIIIILGLVLLLLIAALIGVFLFKNEIVNLFK